MKPENEGARDFYRGQLTNPYNPDTSRARNWEMGFNKAYFEQLEKVKRIENGSTNETFGRPRHVKR